MKSANPTFDADSGAPINDTTASTTSSTIPTASIINVPPQIAVTICWIAVGFALCWYMTRPKRRGESILG